MEMRHLKYFVAVAEAMNFHRAAENLHMSQPPLSKRIRELEAELGTQLFIRSGRGISLTPEGQYFLKRAKEILNATIDAQEGVNQISRGVTGHLNLAYCDDTLYSNLSDLFAQFHQKFPSVFVGSKVDLSLNAINQILSGELDAAIVVMPLPVEAEGLSSLLLGPAQLKILLPKHHPLANQRKINLRALKEERFVLGSQNPTNTFRSQVNQLFADADFRPTVVHHSNDSLMYTRVAAKAGYISIASEFSIDPKSKDFACIDIDHKNAQIPLAWVWDKHNANPVLRNFLSCLNTMVSY